LTKRPIGFSNAASFIMNLTYGIHIAPREDRYVTIAEKALAGVSEAAKPGEFLVDLLPFCTHLFLPRYTAVECYLIPFLYSEIRPVSSFFLI
jgi:hypothetical protein